MSANLITGNLFKPIYAYQDADYQAGISGNVTSIMPVGSQMALSIEDANTIKADDGVLITKEGRRIQIDAGAIEEWSIPTGTQGQTNYYIVGFRLYTDNTSAEICETFVEQMENATDTIPEDTFRGGATEVYVSLGRVVQNGINLESVTELVTVSQSLEDLILSIGQLANNITSLTNTVNTKANATSVVASITRSGTNFTAKNANGTQLFTFNQQDNNTTYTFKILSGQCSISKDNQINQWVGSVNISALSGGYVANAKAYIPLGCRNTGWGTNGGQCWLEGTKINCAFVNSVGAAYVWVLQITQN